MQVIIKYHTRGNRITKELKLRPLTYSFNEEENEILNTLTFKINNKQKLTEDDMNDLSLISFNEISELTDLQIK